jgi:lipopolysaccharide/colanic/teichoic acid biosynthesis glycosyltransferase
MPRKRRAELEHPQCRETAFKIHDDPSHPDRPLHAQVQVDEWPQLWNVIRGEMSLVGPRRRSRGSRKVQALATTALRMRPGLTCLWAINGRDELDFETWMKLDMQYIDRWSLALDWQSSCGRSASLLGKGAH